MGSKIKIAVEEKKLLGKRFSFRQFFFSSVLKKEQEANREMSGHLSHRILSFSFQARFVNFQNKM